MYRSRQNKLQKSQRSKYETQRSTAGRIGKSRKREGNSNITSNRLTVSRKWRGNEQFSHSDVKLCSRSIPAFCALGSNQKQQGKVLVSEFNCLLLSRKDIVAINIIEKLPQKVISVILFISLEDP